MLPNCTWVSGGSTTLLEIQEGKKRRSGRYVLSGKNLLNKSLSHINHWEVLKSFKLLIFKTHYRWYGGQKLPSAVFN